MHLGLWHQIPAVLAVLCDGATLDYGGPGIRRTERKARYAGSHLTLFPSSLEGVCQVCLQL